MDQPLYPGRYLPAELQFHLQWYEHQPDPPRFPVDRAQVVRCSSFLRASHWQTLLRSLWWPFHQRRRLYRVLVLLHGPRRAGELVGEQWPSLIPSPPDPYSRHLGSRHRWILHRYVRALSVEDCGADWDTPTDQVPLCALLQARLRPLSQYLRYWDIREYHLLGYMDPDQMRVLALAWRIAHGRAAIRVFQNYSWQRAEYWIRCSHPGVLPPPETVLPRGGRCQPVEEVEGLYWVGRDLESLDTAPPTTLEDCGPPPLRAKSARSAVVS